MLAADYIHTFPASKSELDARETDVAMTLGFAATSISMRYGFGE
jgi:hypothetical protein